MGNASRLGSWHLPDSDRIVRAASAWCQGNYCQSYAIFLTPKFLKRDNAPNFYRYFLPPMKRGRLCRSLSLLLVVSLLAPSPGLAQPSPSVSPPIGTQPAPPSGTTMRPAQPAVTPSPGAAPASVRGTMPGPDYR